jgi:hypothetical protein
LGIVVAIGLAIATSGIALIPIGVALGLTFYFTRRHHKHQPGYLGQKLIENAKAAATPADAVALFHEAMDTDPAGKDTLLASAEWFFDKQCWADAADAYAAYLHVATTPYYEIRHAQCLVGAGHLDEAVAELDHLRSEGLDESDRALVLSHLALAFALKSDPAQGLALANEAGLQKHVLSSGAQRCLMVRSMCRYLIGQKSKAIEDIERLYAINSSPEVVDVKSRMQNDTFQVDVPKPYPDWYPAKVELREGPIVEQVEAGHTDELRAEAISPDGKWRWSGSQWEATPEAVGAHPAPVASATAPARDPTAATETTAEVSRINPGPTPPLS